MSILNFPRIYFNGHMYWNPPTANNNDALPLYDAAKVDMNWPFLAHYGINPSNAAARLHPWMIQPQAASGLPEYVLAVPTNAGSFSKPFMPAEWDMFGDNACGAVDYGTTQSLVVGGELAGKKYISSDSLINKNYRLLGNPFGGTQPTPARFVDISPWQNTFTALYFDQFTLGDANTGLILNRQHRMLDRFLNFNWGALGGLNFVTTTWQSSFSRDHIQWACGDSVLLQQLLQQMDAQKAKGLMLRFSTYLTFYDKNGIFNNYPPVDTRSNSPAAQAKLREMYQKGLDNVADIFFNPAYSRTAGTVGLWFDGEFPTAPGGRRLLPTKPLPKPLTPPGGAPTTLSLGVMSGELHGNILSLDVANTFPFYPIDSTAAIPVSEKFDLGNLDLGVVDGNKAFNHLATLSYPDYNQRAFDKRSGLIDISLNESQIKLLGQGPLELRAQNNILSQQQEWTAEVIESGAFVDVGEQRTLQIMLQLNGKPAPAGKTFWVAQYGNPFMLTTSNYYLCSSNLVDFVLYDKYPDNSKNSARLPQFKLAVAQQKFTQTSGSGHNVNAVLLESSSTVAQAAIPVRYSSVLQSPVGVSLAPCVSFMDTAVAAQGVLEDGTLVEYQLAKAVTNAQGIAEIKIQGVQAGFPTLRFYLADKPEIAFSFDYTGAYVDFLVPLRVLPKEPQLIDDFIRCWNSVYQQADAGQQIWEKFIYPRILSPYYYLYPIMNKYMPLNNLARIEGAVDQLIVLISKPYQEESTLAMPITRDLPQSRRAVLNMWASKLVKLGYPPKPLPFPIGDAE